jgi:cytochrome c peroxidase
MKRALGLALLAGLPLCAAASSLEISIRHTFNGEPLQLNAVCYRNGAGEEFSITRASYFISGCALERPDGSWLELTNVVAWLDAETSRTSLRLTNVAAGAYRSLRFHIGLDAAMNHSPVTSYLASHPLNPNLNGLHWSWQGGYIFLALEGRWRDAAGNLDGYSFHLARDTNRARVHLAGAIDLARASRMELDFDLGSLLHWPRPISFAKDGSSTHSRDGDPIAAALVANLSGAFHVRRLAAIEQSPVPEASEAPLDLPKQFTPYRFAMSATFPRPNLPRDNPLIEERVALGEKLFHEPLLSRDGTISCASCHEFKAAFSDSRRYSVGVGGQSGARQSMPLFNLAWRNSFFWDGRASTLREQALIPIQDHKEMGESLTNVVAKLAGKTESGKQKAEVDYVRGFAAAFGSTEVTAEKIGLALESFVLTLTSFDSKFDRAFRGEEKLSDEEQRGFELFMTEYDPRRGQYGADCFHCHGGALFQSQAFANNGLDTFKDIADEIIAPSGAQDLGRYQVTKRAADAGKFATPSLRNIALTAPYMHDGRFATLEEVVEHYSTGVRRSPTLDPNLAKHPEGGLHLSASDQHALVAFLKTLTDEKFLIGNGGHQSR